MTDNIGTLVIDSLPKRKDGTKVTPWDHDWTNDVSRGVFEPSIWRNREVKARAWNFSDAKVTGEKVDHGLMLMFVEGGYTKLFDRLYGGENP